MERISYSKIAFGVVFFIPHLRKGVLNVFAVNVDGKHLGEATNFFVSLLPVQFAVCVNLSDISKHNIWSWRESNPSTATVTQRIILPLDGNGLEL